MIERTPSATGGLLIKLHPRYIYFLVPLFVFFVSALGLGVIGKHWDSGYRLLAHVCHQKSERCLWICTRPMGLCARCTGVHLGVIASCATMMLQSRNRGGKVMLRLWVPPALLIPTAADVAFHNLTGVTSAPVTRLLAGFLYGSGCAIVLLILINSLLVIATDPGNWSER
jgi:uncharacterized membrane protein